MSFKKIIVGIIAFTLSNVIYAQKFTSEQVKSAYLLNFTKYIEWPGQESLEYFHIGIYGGDNAVYEELTNQQSRQTIGKTPLKVSKVERNFNPANYQVIFISESENNRIKNIASKCVQTNTLLVTDESNNMQNIMINFQRVEDSRIVFQINKSNLVYEGLKVSKDILLLGGSEIDVATLYKETEKMLEETEKLLDEAQVRVQKQLKEKQHQKKKIKKQEVTIQKQIAEIGNQQAKIKDQQLEIEKRTGLLELQQEQVREQKLQLKRLEHNQQNKELLLSRTKNELESRIDEKNNMELKINSYKSTLDSLASLISDSQKEIFQQKTTLTEQGSTIKKQQGILFFGGLILLLVIALVIAIFRGYYQKKESNKQLEQKNAQLHDANTELNITLEKLRHAQTKLVQSEKMASLGVLTAGIAHEINNPVTFVSVGAHSLKRNYGELLKIIDFYDNLELRPDEDVKKMEKLKEEHEYEALKESLIELIDDISLGAERTTQIIKGLRDFSRLDDAEFSDSNICEGIESALLLLRNKYHNRIEIIKKYPKKDFKIQCYPGQLNQVFMNILHNSIDAIEGEGSIYVTVSRQGESAFVTFRDTGDGMSEEVRRRIFDPFFTTKEVGKGTGLGLSISFGIIEKHHGKIEVKSEINKGTEFNLTLPIHQKVKKL